MAAPTVYTAQAKKEYIEQRFLGNQAVLEQKLEEAGNFLGRCATQMHSTDQMAETFAAKMQEDEQRIKEVVARANKTRDGVSTVYDKVVEMHAGTEVMKKELEETIKHNDHGERDAQGRSDGDR